MPQMREEYLQAIEAEVRHYPNGASVQEIAQALGTGVPRRTLQYRLRHLVNAGRLHRTGERRAVKYQVRAPGQVSRVGNADFVPATPRAVEIQAYVRQPQTKRKPVGYNRDFLGAYYPNGSAYFTASEHNHLRAVGSPLSGGLPAGTYAKQILGRLLIDLSWNSSRLEGNTYSLLDTFRLINFGKEAPGKDRFETQMILNHKDAIEYLVDGASIVGFNRTTLLNLHGLLANNLLGDPGAAGRLRFIPVGIGRSVYRPVAIPQLIDAYFDELLDKASRIEDPFEQSFFILVQLPYLQPFDDVNKRVSRLAANIPLIKHNLVPLSFTDVANESYTAAMLGVYELNRVDYLKEIYIWAYERSARHYQAIRQSLGEPDPLRLKYRTEIKELIGDVIRNREGQQSAIAHIEAWAEEHLKGVAAEEQAKFRLAVETDLACLHSGNYARYRITPLEFERWQSCRQHPSEPLDGESDDEDSPIPS